MNNKCLSEPIKHHRYYVGSRILLQACTFDWEATVRNVQCILANTETFKAFSFEMYCYLCHGDNDDDNNDNNDKNDDRSSATDGTKDHHGQTDGQGDENGRRGTAIRRYEVVGPNGARKIIEMGRKLSDLSGFESEPDVPNTKKQEKKIEKTNLLSRAANISV